MKLPKWQVQRYFTCITKAAEAAALTSAAAVHMAFPWWLFYEYETLVLKISYQLCLLYEYVDDNLHEFRQTVHVGDQTENILDCPTSLTKISHTHGIRFWNILVFWLARAPSC